MSKLLLVILLFVIISPLFGNAPFRSGSGLISVNLVIESYDEKEFYDFRFFLVDSDGSIEQFRPIYGVKSLSSLDRESAPKQVGKLICVPKKSLNVDAEIIDDDQLAIIAKELKENRIPDVKELITHFFVREGSQSANGYHQARYELIRDGESVKAMKSDGKKINFSVDGVSKSVSDGWQAFFALVLVAGIFGIGVWVFRNYI